MKTMDHLHEERELRMQRFPLSIALFLVVMGIDIASNCPVVARAGTKADKALGWASTLQARLVS